MKLTAKEITKEDIPLLLDYWYSASPEYLKGMGADHSKIPSRDGFHQNLEKQIDLPYESKQAYATIWHINGIPCGHCNINQIKYNSEASMHLHLWQNQNRKRGMGTALIKKSIPFFFKNFKLDKIICEPYALNPAPNKIIPKIGFTFIKNHHTTPGSINFPQDVNRYEMTKEQYIKLNKLQ